MPEGILVIILSNTPILPVANWVLRECKWHRLRNDLMETFWELFIEISQHFPQNYLWVYAPLRYVDKDIYAYGKYIKQKPLLYQKGFFPLCISVETFQQNRSHLIFGCSTLGSAYVLGHTALHRYSRMFLLRTSPIRDGISKPSLKRAFATRKFFHSFVACP